MAQLSLLQSLLGEKNPVAGWAGDNSNLLLGIGGSLLSRGMDFSNLPAYAALDTQAAQQKADAANTAQQKNATQEWLAKNYPQYSNLPIDQGWQLAMQLEGQKNSPKAMPDPIKLGAGETLFDRTTGQPMFTAPGANGGMADLSLTPQWGVDPQTGQYVMGQIGKDGKFYKTDMGGLQAVDPVTLAGGKAGGTLLGKNQAQAQIDLPNAKIVAEQTKATIQNIIDNKTGLDQQFGNILGVPQQWTPAYPGTPKSDIQVDMDRLSGQAFAQGREILKGGGPITDFESKKAEAAVTEAVSAFEKGSKDKFLAALEDFADAVDAGVKKIEAYASGGGASAAGSGGNSDVNNILNKYGL